MKLHALDNAYLNVSGNRYDPDFINLSVITNDKTTLDERVMFLSEAQKEMLNHDIIKGYKTAVFVTKIEDRYALVADIDINEYKQGNVKTHELVIPDTIQGMLANFYAYNTEVQPILLVHKPHIPLREYVREVASDDFFECQGIQIYVYCDEKADALLAKYQDIDHMYVADGHHRLYSTSILKHKKSMLSCFMNIDDTTIYPIHRILRNIDAVKFDFAKKLFQCKNMLVEAPCVEKNIVKISYQNEVLYVKLINVADDEFWNNDVLRLNTQILTTAFRINNFSDLSFVSGYDFEQGNYILGKHDVLLEVSAVTPSEFIDFIDLDLMMPPKSTCFEPKFPSFLIMKKYK